MTLCKYQKKNTRKCFRALQIPEKLPERITITRKKNGMEGGGGSGDVKNPKLPVTKSKVFDYPMVAQGLECKCRVLHAGSKIFITDYSDAEMSVISKLFPSTQLYLCEFHREQDIVCKNTTTVVYTVTESSNNIHTVNFGTASKEPICTCLDWIQWRIPCRIFFAVC